MVLACYVILNATLWQLVSLLYRFSTVNMNFSLHLLMFYVLPISYILIYFGIVPD